MVIGHRWAYDIAWRYHYCAPLPLGGVESGQWCVGCGVIIKDLKLVQSRLPIMGHSKYLTLDMMADEKGFKPVMAGSFGEYKCKR